MKNLDEIHKVCEGLRKRNYKYKVKHVIKLSGKNIEKHRVEDTDN